MSDILFKKDIADTLDYDRADKTLSARQGLALKNMMAKLRKTMLLEAHPVGSLYWSMNATNPANLFGGTWEQIKDRFIWATTSNPGGTGGAYNQTLSTANLPSHTHSIPSHTHSIPSHTHSIPSHTHTIPSHNHGYTRADSVGYHAVTANEMPSHNHNISLWRQLEGYGSINIGSTTNASRANIGNTPSTGGGASHNHGLSTSWVSSGDWNGNTGSTGGTTGSAGNGNTGSTGGTSGTAGSGTAFSIMPPYLEAYCWKRTA